MLLLFGEQEALYQEFVRQGLTRPARPLAELAAGADPVARSDVPGAMAPASRARARGRGARAHAGAFVGREESTARGGERLNQIDGRLQEIAREVFRDDSLVLTDSAKPGEVPGWDSLAHMNFMLGLEEEFGVEFSEDEFVRFVDIGALKRMLAEKVVVA